MGLNRLFIFTLSFFFVLLGLFGGTSRPPSPEVQKIDSEIQQLVEMKRGYEARALKHEDMAEYLQFDQQAVLETRRHLQLADENRNKANVIQQEIDRLNAQKKQLQK